MRAAGAIIWGPGNRSSIKRCFACIFYSLFVSIANVTTKEEENICYFRPPPIPYFFPTLCNARIPCKFVVSFGCD